MKLTPVTLSAAVLACAALGFFIGRISAPATDAAAGDADASSVSTRPTRAGQPLAGSTGESAARRDATARRAPRETAGGTPEERRIRLESIVRGENALDRSRALLAYIDQLGPGDFQDAIAHFRSLGITEERMGEYSMLLTAWAKADPIGALDYAKANTNGGFAVGTILTAWATSDPDAAIRWANANHEGEGANPHLAGIIRGLAATDPDRATELLTSMPRSRERGQALDGILPHLIAAGPEYARDWINGIEDEALRNGAIQRAANRIANLDPAMAADMLLANPGEAADRTLDDVFETWTRKNPQDALAAMNALPAGDARSNALRGILSTTAYNDPKAAVAMLDRYPNDVNDRVLRSVAWSSFRQDPSVSADLISRYSDPEMQVRMYQRTLGAWLDRDADAARQWIGRNNLPEAVVRNLADRL